ncbi:MAG: TM2 domain-containing protein [Clostridia bacterium]|nr:TM2 domain-containing protein [Clostridia bacterium]
MYCKNCGEQMNDNQAICLKCGVKVEDGNKYCANCGAQLNEGAEVCTACGVAVKKAEDKSKIGGQDKLVMGLIAIFIGGLGIHNFMMGETKKGIIKIVLSVACGIGAILGLIDGIRILMDKYTVDATKFF